MKRRKDYEEDSEMEVDEEERKIETEREEYDDDDDEGESNDMEVANDGEADNIIRSSGTKVQASVGNPFLDSFYSLSSQDPNERSQAARVLLHHCLLGSSANTKDAAYAFRRLLNGLCSGRAAARQGNASALASFLKIAFRLGKMEEIKTDSLANDSTQGLSNGSSILKYIRDRLLSATDPHLSTGKKKRSEERDYQFGRLFGILAVVRSNILIELNDCDEIREVASAMIGDLAELFWKRKWMREPAAHATTVILNLFFESDTASKQAIAQNLIEEVVIPKFLLFTTEKAIEEPDFQNLLQNYSAEQVGICAYIQSQSRTKNLPFPLDKPIVSTQTLPWIGTALSETSVIVQPRTHFVWDTLWCYFTEKPNSLNSSEDDTVNSKKLQPHKLRKTIPFHAEENVIDTIDAIMRIVVRGKLLGMDNGKSNVKSTHERKSLALCVIRNLCGASFVSSISGPMKINTDSQAIESTLLTPDIIRSLFIVVICAGDRKQNASHMLKPLALQVLDSLVQSSIDLGDANRQLAFVKAFSNCDPRFDQRTKTSTIVDLLTFSGVSVPAEVQNDVWENCLVYLETKFLQLCDNSNDFDSVADINGYVELLYGAAKILLQSSNDDNQDRKILYNESYVKRIIGFFQSIAFFDCSNVVNPTKGKKVTSGMNFAVEGAIKIRDSLQEGKCIAYSIRSAVSIRFFSLISEFVIVASRLSTENTKRKVEKDSIMLAFLLEICDNWTKLESIEAQRFVSHTEDMDSDEDEDTAANPEFIISYLQSKVTELKLIRNDDDEVQLKRRCSTGLTVLGLTLHLHRLTCGSKNEIDEDLGENDKEDEQEICNVLQRVKDLANDFIEGSNTDCNPLLDLTEICANILSSPIAANSAGRVAAPKLVREAVRYAWVGGLKLSSGMATKEKSFFDSSVVNVLMEAIGASSRKAEFADDDVEMDGSSDEDNQLDDSSDSEEKEDLLSNQSSLVPDRDTGTSSGNEDDSDVELDPCKLQTMLEDDSDADVDEFILEHHEGADDALAKFIKLKQDSRKAGQQAQEKIEVSNQLRCTFLVDLLLLGRTDSWNKIFRSNTVLEMILPLLSHRKSVGKLTQKAVESGKNRGFGEKHALLKRLTSLIKQGLLKIRLSTIPFAGPIDMDAASRTFQEIMKEAKKCKDKEQLSCCSSCLIYLLKNMLINSSDVISLATTEYGGLIRAWSTKRMHGPSPLDDLISQMPTFAQISLVSALSRAAQDTRSLYLKAEAFRLLSSMFVNTQNEKNTVEMKRIAQAKIHESQHVLLSAFRNAFIDKEMMKPRRARIILKAFEKFLPFLSNPVSPEAMSKLIEIKTDIDELGVKQSSFNTIAEKLLQNINARLEELNATAAKDITSEQASTATSKKLKKKKKKKKKQ